MSGTPNLAALEAVYRDRLEADLVAAVATLAGLGEREAMDLYYRSRLSREIDRGDYGIQYLDPEVLAADLLANEPELFAHPSA
ncbi:MAG: hypothetical protein LBL01_00170 [Bifidobacteriaceae bacterium]|jgi:hypothetical protein|nr:hypothetical protein [Bifidobacteriaceae bacterium]